MTTQQKREKMFAEMRERMKLASQPLPRETNPKSRLEQEDAEDLTAATSVPASEKTWKRGPEKEKVQITVRLNMELMDQAEQIMKVTNTG